MAHSRGGGRFYSVRRLPYKRPHCGPGMHSRLREQFGHMTGGKLRDILAVNSISDEQSIDPCPIRAFDVCEKSITDGQRSFGVAKRGADAIMDWRVWLSVIDDGAAELFVSLSQSTGTKDELAAALHDKIRIGAEHDQTAPAQTGEHVSIVVGSLRIILVEAGAEDDLRLLGIAQLDVQALEHAAVPLRSEMQHVKLRARGTPCQVMPGGRAGRDDGVETVEWHAEAAKLVFEVLCRAWRIGQKHNAAELIAKMLQRIACRRKCGRSIVQIPPDIADESVIVRR